MAQTRRQFWFVDINAIPDLEDGEGIVVVDNQKQGTTEVHRPQNRALFPCNSEQDAMDMQLLKENAKKFRQCSGQLKVVRIDKDGSRKLLDWDFSVQRGPYYCPACCLP